MRLGFAELDVDAIRGHRERGSRAPADVSAHFRGELGGERADILDLTKQAGAVVPPKVMRVRGTRHVIT